MEGFKIWLGRYTRNWNTLYNLIFLFVFLLRQTLVHTTSISVRAPVNPVEENGIISVYCEVTNLEERWQEVTIYRNVTTRIEKLSLDNDVLPKVGDRVFLAKRQNEGASFVYFLSIIEATKEDSGEYVCQVADKASIRNDLPKSKVDIQTTYFPLSTDPICWPSETKTVTEGEMITLSCSSEQANPVVDIKWHRSGSDDKLQAREYIENGRKYSVATITVLAEDSGVFFICEITSEAYYDKTQTCHYGPLKVVSTEGNVLPNLTPNIIPVTASNIQNSDKTQDLEIISNTRPSADLEENKCKNVCSTKSNSLFYWILATISASVLALLFLIIVVMLFMKSRHIDNNTGKMTETYVGPRMPLDDIYTELEHRRCQQKVYLSIQKGLKRDPE